MESRNAVMQEIFSELSERNKDIMILAAKSVNMAQKDAVLEHVAPKKDARPVEHLDV